MNFNISRSSIEHGSTGTFFHMVDQYFGNDSLEPLKANSLAPQGSR